MRDKEEDGVDGEEKTDGKSGNTHQKDVAAVFNFSAAPDLEEVAVLA